MLAYVAIYYANLYVYVYTRLIVSLLNIFVFWVISRLQRDNAINKIWNLDFLITRERSTLHISIGFGNAHVLNIIS